MLCKPNQIVPKQIASTFVSAVVALLQSFQCHLLVKGHLTAALSNGQGLGGANGIKNWVVADFFDCLMHSGQQTGMKFISLGYVFLVVLDRHRRSCLRFHFAFTFRHEFLEKAGAAKWVLAETARHLRFKFAGNEPRNSCGL